MAQKDCTNVNIPQVDNTLQECGCDLYSSSCVVVNKRFPFVSPKNDLPMNDFLDELINLIKTQDYRIKVLENKVKEGLSEIGIGLY